MENLFNSKKLFVLIFATGLILAAIALPAKGTCPTSSCPSPLIEYTVGGLKFNDLDGDGQRTSLYERGLSDWTITITGEGINRSTTTRDGLYYFSVNPGTYTICEEQQSGWEQTFPTDNNGCHIVEVTNSCVPRIDFGNHLPDDHRCGDEVVNGDEECDDGNNIDGDGCSADCKIEHYCGDEVVNGDEECDDGNNIDGDGCSADCKIEQPECIPEGGSGPVIPDGPECCEGLTAIGCDQPDHSGECSEECVGAFYCTYCGNGVCGLGENKCNCPEDCEEEEPEYLTILGYKVVCDSEEYLPNWGDGQDVQMITEQIINEFVHQNSQYCHLEENWDFQWGLDGEAQKQSGDHIGPAPQGTGWNDFDTSTGIDPAEVELDDDELNETNKIWIRENLKEGYIPFSYPPGDAQDDLSAEIYCHNDILNYDNYDYIANPQLGETYYCVAFNAPSTEHYCGDEVVNGDEECDDGNNIDGDGCSADCKIEQPECIPEGGSGPVIPDGPECCEGLTAIGCDQPDHSGECSEECVGAFYCTYCGNGVCGLGENKCNCPEDCEEEEPVCENIVVVSNEEDDVFDTEGTFLNKAVPTYDLNSAWTAVIDAATWIWKSYLVENPGQNETYVFSKEFNIIGAVSSSTLRLAADNTYKAWINDILVGEDLTEFNYNNVSEFDVTDKLQSGTNTVKFEVMNMGVEESNSETNPAGLLYRLDIERSSCSALYVIKDVVDGSATSGDFTIDVSGDNPSPASFPGQEAPGTLVTLNPGDYDVTESTISDYTASFSDDCSSTIAVDEVKTCTITNTYDSDPYCGDGTCDDDETCSNCSEDCGNCGGGGGGGGGGGRRSTPRCGDGKVNGDEECDGTAGVTEGYTCNDSCVLVEIICELDLNVMMIMDVSGSMEYNEPSRLSQAKIAANNFINNLRDSDQSGLVSFSWTATLDKGLSNDHSSTQSIIDGLVAEGATNIGDAVDKANDELISVEDSLDIARIGILLTDGRANKPNGNGFEENPADLALALTESVEAAENGITLFTIGLGDNINEEMLQTMAENTGGKYYLAPTSEDLESVFNQIASETCKSTTTEYLSPPVAIFNASIESVSNTSVIVSWFTNIPATSRVIYDTVSHSDLGDSPNYGYAYSTAEDTNKTTFHTVTITDLIPGTAYYWRPISQASPEAQGDELMFTTTLEEVIEEPVEIEEEPEEFVEEIIEENLDGVVIEEETPEERRGFLASVSAGISSLIDAIRNASKGFNKQTFLYVILGLVILFIVLLLLFLILQRRKKNEGSKGGETPHQ